MDSSETTRVRVALVYGGRSSEHGVSCVTAGSVLQALDPARFEVVPIGITRDGRWVRGTSDPAALAIHDGRMPEVDDEGPTVVLDASAGHTDLVALSGTPRSADATPVTDPAAGTTGVDVVLPLLHGPFGEDGTLQGLLELAGTPYVGSGVLASAISMDKHMMKQVLAAAGLPVGAHVLVPAGDWGAQREPVHAQVAALGWPVFVKPARAGSSMGITRVTGPDGLDAAVQAAREHDPRVVIEAAIPGREVECGVLEGLRGGPPETSVLGEIRIGAGHDFYDFDAKYLDEAAVSLDVPADLDDEQVARAQDLARASFAALSCEGLARVDLFLTPQGDLVVNEVNTMPGFTPTSMFPRLWAQSGLDYPALVERLLQTSLDRPRHPSGLR